MAFRAPRESDIYFEANDDVVGDRGIYVSHDGDTVITDRVNERHLKRRRLAPTELQGDQFARWTPVNDPNNDPVAHAVADTVTSFDVEPDSDNDDDDDADGSGVKRKRYLSSDQPMLLWRELMQDFVDFLMRLQGLGEDHDNPCCALCSAVYRPGSVRIFRCKDCGQFLQCQDCILSRHKLSPLHVLKEWNGAFWADITLQGLNLVYQLGHGGLPCERPERAMRTMVVLHVNGIHQVDYHRCKCDRSTRTNEFGELIANEWYPATTIDPETCATFAALDLFRLLSVVGNMNVHDFVGSLERMTDSLRTSSVPDRYKAFGRMSRQYAFCERAKHTGLVHAPKGVKRTKSGEMGLDCWTCPHRRNLPNGWDAVDAKYQFLYMLILAMDANFRLKNRLRTNEHQDDSLGPGFSYFVEPNGYRTHLKDYVAEKDVSTCIAFAALLQKETRMTTGLRASGVGGCVCARHGLVRPQGLGDLQKGERYANMDYIFLSSIIGIVVLWLAISYDIACQWKIHLLNRAKKINEVSTTLKDVKLDKFYIQYGLPVWHAAAHETSCQAEHSLSYAQGVGRTDGEGIERTWAVLNPLGFATKEMGRGTRIDAIDDKIDHLNFEKNIHQGDTLARKLIVAIPERDRQVAAFKEVNRTLADELRLAWKKKIDAWVKDKTQPNPFYVAGGKSAGPSEAQVRLELNNDDAAEAASGNAPVNGPSATASAFITAGMQLEDAQRRIKAELKGQTLVTADQASQIQERRIAFFKKLRKFEKLQRTYMPGVAQLIEAAEERRDSEAPAPKAENVRLWMPSELTAAERRASCRKGLVQVEARYRAAQCEDTLELLRTRLHAQAHLIQHRNANSVGQRSGLRSATLIGRVGDRIRFLATKYRGARKALVALKGDDFAPQYQDLLDTDLNTGLEQESDHKARKKLARLGSTKGRNRNAPSNKPRKLSWIWTVTVGAGGHNEEQVRECVRVEWSKALARRDRWVEEVDTLREEMKRVLRSLAGIAIEWEERASLREKAEPGEGVFPAQNHALIAGLRAYSAKQAELHRCVMASFHHFWSSSLQTAVREVVRKDGTTFANIIAGRGEDLATMQPLGLEDVEEGVAAEGRQHLTRATTRAAAAEASGSGNALASSSGRAQRG
ncbi:hypothetical protein C8R43DRAFT_1122949 [Mycena crocata]|nr:hypothetical protein C8R43DRAFT_1122949 [Mycena crocata]